MRDKKKKLLLIFLMAFLLITLISGTASAVPPTDYAALAYPSFGSTEGLTLSGNASLDDVNSRIKIVPYTNSQAGGVFTANKVSMGSNGFSLAAQVYCGPTGAQADGFALVLSKDTNVCTSDTGGSLGYANMANSIAVQYFTYAASNIALGINGEQNKDDSIHTGFYVPQNGSVYIWADYDAATTTLAVYASLTGTRPSNPVTTYTIDLSSYIDYHLGVTAATGDSCQEYALAQWYYDDYYNSSSLKLDGSVNYTDALAADQIIAQSATNITSSSATLRGVWGSDYEIGYTKGIAYKEGLAGTETEVTAAADGTVDVSNLNDGTLYYYRAYATDGTNPYVYSNPKAFSTENQLTVSGNAAPYYMGIALAANDNGSYSVHTGMEITMQANTGYKLNQVKVNGTSITSPWKFTVSGNTAVVVTTEENSGDFWVYDGCYVFGVYDEDSDEDDIDWSESVYSYDDPLAGAYSNANVYILDYEELYIDQLNLGHGSIICKDNYNSYFYLYGYDDDSYLIADSIINEYDSGDIYIYGLDVYVNSIYTNDELDIYNDSHVMADTVTFVINCCGMDISGNSSLTAGTIYAAVDDYSYNSAIYIYTSTLTADEITGTLSLEVGDNSTANIENDVVTDYFEVWNNGIVNISGDLTTTNSASELYENSLLNVGGTITTADGNKIYSLNAAILNAASGSDTPYYNDTAEAYVRTTLTGLPANTLMHFVTDDGTDDTTYDMDFWARTSYANQLTVWLIPGGGTITATTKEDILYTSTDTIGNAENTINMSPDDDTLVNVTITADVPYEQASGQAVSYSNFKAVTDTLDLSTDVNYITRTLYDVWGNVVTNSNLQSGTYYLTFTYCNNYGLYGTATYTVHVRDQRTISFDTDGGSSVEDILAFKGDDLTLPTATKSGYRLTGWFDGALTYDAGYAYLVYVDSELVAQWAKKTSSTNNDEVLYTITATAGAGGSISPPGSVEVAESKSKAFTITADAGYVIADVLVDGKSVGAVSKYTFSNVTANHTIKATFVATATTNPASQFTDLVTGAWYMDGIEYVLQAALFNGTSTTTFSPNANMTRAMLVTVLWRLNGTTDTSINSFDDVEAGLWYSDAVKWAAANSIVAGFGNNTFRPGDSITREQLALILYNYANFMGYDTTQGGMAIREYADYGDISSWAGEAFAWAVNTGLITGRTDTTLAPGGTATRAEVATILMRFIEYYAQ